MLGGLMMLHLGSLWVHERALHGAESGARVDRLAERLSAAALAVSAAPEAGRDAAAHALSLPGIELHWVRISPVPEGAPAAELAAAAARLGPAARLAWDPQSAPGHQVVGALPVQAGGWLVFFTRACRPGLAQLDGGNGFGNRPGIRARRPLDHPAAASAG